jgi:ketosteroid isomerase-like protein
MHASAGTVLSQDEDQIRQLMTDQEIAMRRRDAEWLAARYAPDAVTFGLAPPLANSGPDLRDPSGLRKWFAGFDGPIEYEIRDLTVAAGSDVAICHSLNRLSTTPHGAPGPFELWFRATVGLRKIDGRWLVIHEHNSTPFYMDGSFRAAVDLTP